MKKKSIISEGWKFNVGETIVDSKRTAIKIQIVSRGPFVTEKMRLQEVYLVKSASGPTLFTLPKDQVDRHYRRAK